MTYLINASVPLLLVIYSAIFYGIREGFAEHDFCFLFTGILFATVIWQRAHKRRYGFYFDEPGIGETGQPTLVDPIPAPRIGRWSVNIQLIRVLVLLAIGLRLAYAFLTGFWYLVYALFFWGAVIGTGLCAIAYRSRYGFWFNDPAIKAEPIPATRIAATSRQNNKTVGARRNQPEKKRTRLN